MNIPYNNIRGGLFTYCQTVILFCILLLGINQVNAQQIPVNSIKDERSPIYAFINATLHVDAYTVVENATLLIENEKILDAGKNVKIPNEAIVIDCSGKHILPSFIDAYSTIGMPVGKKTYESRPQYTSSKKGPWYWNETVHPEVHGARLFEFQDESASGLRQKGFGLANVHQRDGIVRGTGAVVALSNHDENKIIVKPYATQHFSFNKGQSRQEYPGSQTGAIALMRQFFYDVEFWKNEKNRKETNLSLEDFLQWEKLPYVLETSDKQEIFRGARIAKEFGFRFVYKAVGNEYQRAADIASLNTTLIIPLTFPQAMDMTNAWDANEASLSDLKHWEMAPLNPSVLKNHQIRFAITSDGCSMPDFFQHMYKACHHGLDSATLLAALTTVPAEILGLSSQAGSLHKNKWANFLITEAYPGHEKFRILENWIMGKQYVTNARTDQTDFTGEYLLQIPELSFFHLKKLVVVGQPQKYQATLHISDSTKIACQIKQEQHLISLHYYAHAMGGFVRISIHKSEKDKWSGLLTNPNGHTYNIWLQQLEVESSQNNIQEKDKPIIGETVYPFRSFGFTATEWKEVENKKSWLITNTTVWTCESTGVLTQADVWIENGKIRKVGRGIKADKDAIIIDGSGLHLTPGLIDEHSHIALSRGVNEAAESSSAEVRMSDVINAEDINIYRQLAGGVTTSQLLHGSANPIGGQSALIKLRWGRSAEQMLFENAPGFIKFALGENVKQSNWGDAYSIRYPQSRMGVEQFYYDMFAQAVEYAKKKEKDRGKNMELEILVEILQSKRFITCHSYVQSEINMLMKVADSLGFKVNTFTHILEGYKVADKMKSHPVNASTFSDWWAYKMEVMDAIPYNASLLTRMGVNTCINSDDAEMARRLNQEAAKAIKYGGLTREEALKLVTINPARMLRIDHKVGSIREGKDADIVIWSDEPLSIYAKPLYTFVDGIQYYSYQRNQELIQRDKKEKNRLIQKMLDAMNNGHQVVPITLKKYWLYDCEDLHADDEELLRIEP